MRKIEPNPLEVLGVSFLIARAHQDNPEALYEIVKAAYRALAKLYHPDVNSADSSKMVIYNMAWNQVNSVEGVAEALKKYLTRGGEHLDIALEMTSVREDLATANQTNSKLRTRANRLEQDLVSVRRALVQRTFPAANESDQLHYLNAAWMLIATETFTNMDGYQHFNILWVDSRGQVSAREIRFKIDIETKIKEEFELTIAQLQDSLPFGQPTSRPLHYKGILYGTTAKKITSGDREKDLFDKKPLEIDDFLTIAERISPYLTIGQELITIKQETKRIKGLPTRLLINIEYQGRIRWIRPLLTSSLLND